MSACQADGLTHRAVEFMAANRAREEFRPLRSLDGHSYSIPVRSLGQWLQQISPALVITYLGMEAGYLASWNSRYIHPSEYNGNSKNKK